MGGFEGMGVKRKKKKERRRRRRAKNRKRQLPTFLAKKSGQRRCQSVRCSSGLNNNQAETLKTRSEEHTTLGWRGDSSLVESENEAEALV